MLNTRTKRRLKNWKIRQVVAAVSTLRAWVRRPLKSSTTKYGMASKGQEEPLNFRLALAVQSTTVIVETVLVETTVLVEQKPLTTQFYLLLVESPF